MVNIDTSRCKLVITNFHVFSGPAGSGKTIEMVKAAVSYYTNSYRDMNLYVLDLEGGIKTVCNSPVLSEWCGVTPGFKTYCQIIQNLSDIPQGQRDGLLLIDGFLAPEVRNQLWDMMMSHQTIELMIMLTHQTKRAPVKG